MSIYEDQKIFYFPVNTITLPTSKPNKFQGDLMAIKLNNAQRLEQVLLIDVL
jgi:hypothetical protein